MPTVCVGEITEWNALYDVTQKTCLETHACFQQCPQGVLAVASQIHKPKHLHLGVA